MKHTKTLISVLTITLYAAFGPSRAVAQTNWVWRNPLPQGNDLRAAAFGNNRYAAVGLAGAVVTSTDGLTWTCQHPPTTNDLFGVTFGNGQFVAVGKGGEALTSPDGLAWTEHSTGAAQDLLAVAYGGSAFIAVGRGGKLLASPTGATWSARTSGVTADLYGVSFGSGQGFKAVGDAGVVTSSANGSAWSAATIDGSYYLAGITWDGAKFVAVGWSASDHTGIIVTYESGRWTRQTPGVAPAPWLDGVSYNAALGELVAVGAGGTALSSFDGWSWSPAYLEAGELFGSAAGGSRFVAVGQSGSIYSLDLSVWTARSRGPLDPLRALASGEGGFVAVGDGGVILSSRYGRSWTIRPSGVTNDLRGASAGAGKLVVVGSRGCVLSSTDARSWTSQTSGITSDLAAVVFGSNTFVAVGASGHILTSTNGADWAKRSSGVAGSLSAIAWGGGRFVAVSDGGDLLTSANGATWTRQASALFSPSGVAYGNGLFVAVDTWGSVQTSPDGLAWSSPLQVAGDLEGVAFSGSNFVAVGPQGTLLTSADGANWKAQNSGAAGELKAVTAGDGQIIIAGDRGTILAGGNIATLPDPPEIIISTSYLTGTALNYFYFQIVASNDPTNYAATGLPGGLALNAATGVINGTPSAAGTFYATVTAANAGGIATQYLTFSISFMTQYVTFFPPADFYATNPPFTLSASASSGLPVTFTVLSGPLVVSNGWFVITGYGSVTVRAAQAGNAAYQPAYADRTFAILRLPQTVDFPQPTDKWANSPPFSLTASSSSGLPVVFSVVSGPLVVSNNLFVISGYGPATVRASQPGNNTWAPASLDRSFSIVRVSQYITFDAVPNCLVGSPPFGLHASASSGLPVVLTQVAGPPSLNSNLFTPSRAGAMSLRASQPGNNIYSPAADVVQSFYVVGADFVPVKTGLPGIFKVAYGNGRFVAVADGPGAYSLTVATSMDGLNWTVGTLPDDFNRVRYPQRLIFAGSEFVMVGFMQYINPPHDSAVSTSADGWSWTTTTGASDPLFTADCLPPFPYGTTSLLDDVAYGNDLLLTEGWCAGRNGPYYFSVGGLFRVLNGKASFNLLCPNGVGGSCRGLVFGGGIFVFIYGGHCYTTIDGSTLTDWGAFPVLDIPGYYIGRYGDSRPNVRLAYGGGNFVATGVTTNASPAWAILTSPNGTNWPAAPNYISTNTLWDVTYYGKGKFIAVGDAGTILKSEDGGYTWKAVSIGTYATLCSVACTDDRTIVVGNTSDLTGVILMSYQPPPPVPPTPPVILANPAGQVAHVGQDVTFNVVVGGSPPFAYQWRFGGANLPGTTNVSLVLTNVRTDQAGQYAVVVTNVIGAVTSAPATLVIGTVWLDGPGLEAGGRWRLTWHSPAGGRCDLLASSNLTSWQVLTSLTNASGADTWRDPVTNQPRRFYRLLVH